MKTGKWKRIISTLLILTVFSIGITGIVYADMSSGSSGDQVVYVQQLLNGIGYDTYVDGIFGEYTEASVIAFQADYGLYVDGVVGPITLQALEEANGYGGISIPEEPEPEPEYIPDEDNLMLGSYGESVLIMQQALAALGYEIYVDGDYGRQTADVVSRFQQDKGLYVDGIAGPVTLGILYSIEASSQETPDSLNESGDGAEEENSLAAEEALAYLTIGSQGSLVSKVQLRLADLKFDPGPIDGVYGQLTANAVRAYQSKAGLYADGETGPVTLASLFPSTQTTESASDGSTTMASSEHLTWIGDSLSVVSNAYGVINDSFEDVSLYAKIDKRIYDDLEDNPSGLTIAQALKYEGSMSNYLVFALGTNRDLNSNLTPGQKIDQLVNTVGSNTRIVLLTNYIHDDTTTDYNYSTWNAEAKRRAAGNSNIAVADWAGLCSGWSAGYNLGNYLEDGIHPNYAGANAFVNLIRDTIRTEFEK